MMVRSYEYSSLYFPSAPVVEIGLRKTSTAPEIQVEALIDTGADASLMPLALLKRVDASYVTTVSMQSVLGISQRIATYLVAIRVGNIIVPGIRALATKGSEPILGRDVLNQLILTLNGPALTTQIHE